MKLKLLAAALALAASATVSAAPTGESSNYNTIDTRQPSTAIPFGAGKAALRINNSSIRINIGDGPVKHINKKYGNRPINGANINGTANGLANPAYLTVKDVNPVISFFTNPTLGQVWYEKRAANVDVYSVRQITDVKLPIAPKFGGLVIGQVKNLPDNSGVYFGEWAPRKGNSNQIANSTDLNMNDGNRTVWFVGENSTANMPKLANAKYNVLGINKHTPGKNDFYSGVLTANYGAGKNELSGTISRAGDSINFANTKIESDGQFDNHKNTEHITGRFYGNGAEALAGIVDRTGADKDVAFGGRRQ